jgi:hypothetical protein
MSHASAGRPCNKSSLRRLYSYVVAQLSAVTVALVSDPAFPRFGSAIWCALQPRRRTSMSIANNFRLRRMCRAKSESLLPRFNFKLRYEAPRNITLQH